MAMTAEQMQQQIEALTQQVTTLTQQAQTNEARLTAADVAHQQLHKELNATKAQLATSKQGFKLVDPKTMKPDKLGSKGGPAWKQWSEDTRAFVENLSLELAAELKQVEGRQEPLTSEELELLDVAEADFAQMGRFLRLNTEGHINTMVKSSVEKGEHVLETWRLISKELDPKGLGTELVELSDLVSPAKLGAKTPAGISAAIESWEAMERRVKDRQGTKLDDKSRVTCLLKVVPEKMA